MVQLAPLAVQRKVLVVLILVQILRVRGDGGRFYVGLLSYDNDEFRSCCEDRLCTSHKYCNLMFEMQVESYNGSMELVSAGPSPTLNPDDAVTFENFPNPREFQFDIWEGNVNVTVNIYNVVEPPGENEFVDSYRTEFVYNTPSDYYILLVLTSEMTNTNLSIVFRYKCANDPGCFSDCADHSENETCPVNPTPGMTFMTFPGFNKSCEYNCTGATTTPATASTDMATTTEEIDLTTVTEIHETTADETYTTDSDAMTTTDDIAPSLTISDETTKSSSKAPSRPTRVVMKTTKPRTTDIPGVIYDTSTTPVVQYVDNSTPYWPAIVGGVLGAVALFAAAGFICYFNRQKKLQKRQEIYNVNPKVLRNFEEYTENGTSGRADVPMETEQY